MISMHFDKDTFMNTMKTKHIVTYICTTIAIMVMLTIYGLIHGNLQPELFVYAFIATLAFAVWNIVDHMCRKLQKAKQKQ